MRLKNHVLFIPALILLIASCGHFVPHRTSYDYEKMDRLTVRIHKRVERFLRSCIEENKPVALSRYTQIDSVIVNKQEKHIDIHFNKVFGYIPLRENNISQIIQEMSHLLRRRFRKYSFAIFAGRYQIESLIPNYYREDSSSYDRKRLSLRDSSTIPLVRNISKPWVPTSGLYARNIALWPSHGWYYDNVTDRWIWQRARLFQEVEDLQPMAYVLPYIMPMLENAGANVFLPRERDLQTHEVIVDNNSSSDSMCIIEENSYTPSMVWREDTTTGFAIGSLPYKAGVNPFKTGTFKYILSDSAVSAKLSWIPNIPATGFYSVYVSYGSTTNPVTDAMYSVFHSGGMSRFLVNQTMGAGTWIYLGSFKFKKGLNPLIGKVILTNESAYYGKYISADAVRFGGGMGNISRNGKTSGRPRYMEGARYYLQYAGMPDTLTYNLHADTNDYKDDYQGRGEWVNYLVGAPYGPNRNRKVKGLGIPIDLSLAFHTDAGIKTDDIVVGTLLIYSTESAESTFVFPDGMSRLANRDFADIMQTQIVEDLRTIYDPLWNRRSLWDSQYSEAFRPNIPAALLELLSHQNFLDMKFCVDPNYRFDVSRSIYKSMLRFIATQNRTPYTVQPLPVSNFQALFEGNRRVVLQWKPEPDSLETSATAEKYIVYRRVEDNGFDSGRLVDTCRIAIENLEPGVIYSFKITAVNAGGESFPSEILSVCWSDTSKNPVIIINGFDRISGPAGIENADFKGFLNFLDQGVPDKYDISFTGNQFSFNPETPFVNNDAPGYGSSSADYETRIIPGNTFDFSFVHGKALRAAGYGFVSTSDEAIMNKTIELSSYRYVDIILGEQKKTPWPKPKKVKRYAVFPQPLRQQLQEYCENGGNLFVSGAYVGTDLFDMEDKDSTAIKFALNTLKFLWRTNHAAKNGKFYPVRAEFGETSEFFKFNTNYHPEIYSVEAPDAIDPVNGSKTIIRYEENNMSAGTAYRGDYNVVILGFPFESILNQKDRNKLMKRILNFFKN